MTLNELVEKIKNADVKKVAAVVIIGIASLWIVREVMFISLFRETAHFIGGIFTAIGDEQREMHERFQKDWNRTEKEFAEDDARSKEYEKVLQKHSQETRKRFDEYFAHVNAENSQGRNKK